MAEGYKASFQYLKASLLYQHKMGREAAARELLLQGWRSGRDAVSCLGAYFSDIADEKILDRELKAIYGREVGEGSRENFLQVPHKAQPVPPIYQPEVAARAILWAATHYRRESVVGFPAWKAIYGNNFFPAYGDRYLARSGYDSQQTGEPKSEQAPDNLFYTVEGHFGTHGRFDDRAQEKDYFFEITKYVPFHYLLLAMVLVLIMAIVWAGT